MYIYILIYVYIYIYVYIVARVAGVDTVRPPVSVS